jgi:oligopeptide/dipeptide ABC transporter ATP-binding protein
MVSFWRSTSSRQRQRVSELSVQALGGIACAASSAGAVLPVLDVQGLTIDVPATGAVLVRKVTLTVHPREIHGLVGETGAGKSLTAWSVLGLLPPGIRRSSGSIALAGIDLATLNEKELRGVRGRDVAIIVQNPRSALVPTMTIGDQLALVHRARSGSSRRDSKQAAIEALADVKIGNPVHRAKDYPHQLSGGQAQRVVIAMASLSKPKLIIADEATTGLDVTVQAEILDLMVEKASLNGSALLLITHDLGVVANYTDMTTAMFAGEVIESGPTESVFRRPAHPYVAGLMNAATLDTNRPSQLKSVAGSAPNLSFRPPGCQFSYRCPYAEPGCSETISLLPIETLHTTRCRRASELQLGLVGQSR